MQLPGEFGHENGTLFDWLVDHSEKQPNSLAISSGTHHTTYSELAKSTRELAAALAKLGVERGDVVAVQLPNCPEFLTILLAVVARGAVLATLHMPYRESELLSLLDHSKAKVVVALSEAKDRQPASEVVSMLPQLESVSHVVAVGAPVSGTTNYSDLTSPEPGEPGRDGSQPARPSDPYLLLYTSGTTAQPKGVMHTSERFLVNAASSAAELGLSPNDRVTSLAPFSHLYGMFTLQIALAAGSCTSMIGVFNPATVLDELADLRPTAIFSAPAHFAPFIAANRLEPELLTDTRILCLSGSAVPPELARSIDDLMVDGSVIGLWGMTELQAGTFGRPDDPIESRISTAGRAAIGARLRVVDDQGSLLPADEVGELEIRCASLFDSYLDNPEASEAAFTDDGWFRTGDLASIDSAGYLRLTGRTKEIINRGGIKYNPNEVEAVLISHPAIAACAIVPIPDPVLGERGCVCVQLVPGESIELDQVVALVEKSGLAKYKWPERLEIFDELPMTPTRKVQRSKLMSMVSK